MTSLAQQARALRAAFVFLTRIPVGGFPYSAEEWRWAGAHFPLVGSAIGALSAGTALAASAALGPFVAGALAVLASVVATGAFHEDGLGDTADTLGAPRERIADILKDPRVGTFGAIALSGTVLLRAALVAELLPEPSSVVAGLVLAHALARGGAVWIMASLPYVTDDERARSRGVTQAGPTQAHVAGLWCGAALVGAWVGGWANAAAVAGTLAALLFVVVACRRWFRERAGGLHGDFLGAAEQLGEVVVLLVWCLLAP